jgi:hypothetical protein
MARDSEALKARYLQGAINDTVTQINGYNNSSAVNGFKLGGKTMWLTLEERQAVKIALDAYEHSGETTMTEVWGGTEYTLPLASYKDMLARIEVYALKCQNITEKHLQAVKELTTVEDVCDYDYTAGYPEMIDFDGANTSESNGTSTSSAEGGGEQNPTTQTETQTETQTDKTE